MSECGRLGILVFKKFEKWVDKREHWEDRRLFSAIAEKPEAVKGGSEAVQVYQDFYVQHAVCALRSDRDRFDINFRLLIQSKGRSREQN